MSWIVLGEDRGKIRLVSGRDEDGILPKGSFLTIEEGDFKTVLRVDESHQLEKYAPSPLVAEMNLGTLQQDQECQNLVVASRLYDFRQRDDGLVNYIKPQTKARRSTEEEINTALGSPKNGPAVFLGTIQASQNQVLRDGSGKPIAVKLNQDMFFHQIQITGKTGSGKTVAIKYLSQYFVEEMKGAALLINNKEIDFLQMEKPSSTSSKDVIYEWENLNGKPHGVRNFVIFYPATSPLDKNPSINQGYCKPVTLDVKKIDPDSLNGLLQNISDTAAMNLPDIFRQWQYEMELSKRDYTFNDFIIYFLSFEQTKTFKTRNQRGDLLSVTLHAGTYQNIKRSLTNVAAFFDNKDARSLEVRDILTPGKMSVINVTGQNGKQFGSILLRDILQKLVNYKRESEDPTPIMIVIDEVHDFYNNSNAMEALGALDTICRMGRSQKIGVIFSSQNPSDLPHGLSNVINTKIFFKSDQNAIKIAGLKLIDEELDILRKGYAVASFFEMSQIKVVKFPLAYAGVIGG